MSPAIRSEGSATPEAEWPLLLSACSVAAPSEKRDCVRQRLQQPMRWPALFDLADQHGVVPLLHQALEVAGNNVPAAALGALQQRCRTNLHKSLLVARELVRILDCLDARGLEVMPYKGLALAEFVYGDMALRQSGDIDLLIHAADLPRIREAVHLLGYVPHAPLSEAEERAYLHSGYECAFDSPAGRNLLEVQWALQPRFYAVDLNMDDLFQRAVTTSVAGRKIKTLSPEDLFVVLSLHAAKHVWGRLIWLCDIARLAQLPGLQWDRIVDQAQSLGIMRILQVTLLLAKRLLGAELPGAFNNAAFKNNEDRAAFALADELADKIACGTSYNVESFAYFRLMMRLRERAQDRMRFLYRLTFTPGPSEWQAVRLPAPLFPLYRLVRLSRLAARLARA